MSGWGTCIIGHVFVNVLENPSKEAFNNRGIL